MKNCAACEYKDECKNSDLRPWVMNTNLEKFYEFGGSVTYQQNGTVTILPSDIQWTNYTGTATHT